jgi:hypothetical protein
MHSERDEIVAALTERDGSCRDVNFIGATWDGVRRLVSAATADFDNVSVGMTSHDTNESSVTGIGTVLDLVQSAGGCAQLLLNDGRGFVSHLQIFVSSERGDVNPDLELTFFPQDVCSTPDVISAFLTWAEHLQALAQATGYYARYENASWRFGETGLGTGVFLARGTANRVTQ